MSTTTTEYTANGAAYELTISSGPTGETATEMRARFHAPHVAAGKTVAACLDCETAARLDRLFR